ncbi:MAG: response regulator transcription factor [Propionibacteriaceae bacterium]|jgi:DNA-binding NarL/FixJ family response regulator|nr:response regulator transcription factor [Propionibacteriaceae bacterium]
MRLVIAEDSVLLREGLVRLFTELGHEVVDAVDDAPRLIESVQTHLPDMVVTDVRMPPTHTDDGLRAAMTIRSTNPEIGLLVLSQWVAVEAAQELLRDGRGAVGYLLKDRVQEFSMVAATLDIIVKGGTMVDPEVIAQITSDRKGPNPLTSRESEVLSLMAEGRSNTAIASQLVVTLGAVEKHIASIFTKLDLTNSSDDHRRVLAVLWYLGG